MGISTYTWGLNASSAPSGASASALNLLNLDGFSLPSGTSLASYAAVGVVGYVSLCAALRFRRIKKLRKTKNFPDRASLARMTVEEAQAITKVAMYYEMPLFYDLSLRLALLKTYAVRNVAKTLVGVSDLAKADTAPKRYEDTAILYSCFGHFKPSDDEWLKAVARMNYLHAPYVKAGKILNKDFLYVLWASMAEPVRFMRLYEWRELTDMEHAAVGTLWKHIGDLMGIDYKAELGNDTWRDGIEFMDEVTAWASTYEDEYMKPYPEVRKLGEVLIELLASSYPPAAKGAVYQGSFVLMGDRMRHAFGFPEPGIAVTAAVYSALVVRRFVIRYLMLPAFSPIKNLSSPDPKTGRMYHYNYMKEPWYQPKTWGGRWSLEAWMTWSFGGILPGDRKDLKPEGFLFEDIGPAKNMGKGHEEIAAFGKLAKFRATDDAVFGLPNAA